MPSLMYTIPETVPLAYAVSVLRTRLAVARDAESGYTTETILITAALAVCALALIGIIVSRITTTGSKIHTGTGPGE
jgi:hypothetical protein